MSKDEALKRVSTIINEVADIPVEEIDESKQLIDDIELSSLEILTIVAEIETLVKKKIPENDLRSFVTVGDIANYVTKNC